MKTVKRKFDLLLTKEERDQAIKDIISYHLVEKDEELDLVGANGILDAFLQDIAPKVYNKAIDDVKKLCKKQAEEVDFELDVLKNY